MEKIKVKVFDAYSGSDNEEYYENQVKDQYFNIWDFQNKILDDEGYIKVDYFGGKQIVKIKPLKKDLRVKTKYILDKEEKENLDKLQHIIDENERKLKESKKDIIDYVHELMKETGVKSYLALEDTDGWKCGLSPFGRCVYSWDGSDYSCIFCGEPEERK